jgi:ATP-binding cassette subfamily B protein
MEEGPGMEGTGAHRPGALSNKELLWRIFRFITPREKKMLAAACVAMSLTSLTNLAFPRLISVLVDGMAQHETPRRRFLASALLLFAAGSVGSWLRTYLFAIANESVATRMRVMLVQRLLLQDMPFFDKTRVQDMLMRITEDTQVTATAATANLAKAYRYVNSALGGKGVAARSRPSHAQPPQPSRAAAALGALFAPWNASSRRAHPHAPRAS